MRNRALRIGQGQPPKRCASGCGLPTALRQAVKRRGSSPRPQEETVSVRRLQPSDVVGPALVLVGRLVNGHSQQSRGRLARPRR